MKTLEPSTDPVTQDHLVHHWHLFIAGTKDKGNVKSRSGHTYTFVELIYIFGCEDKQINESTWCRDLFTDFFFKWLPWTFKVLRFSQLRRSIIFFFSPFFHFIRAPCFGGQQWRRWSRPNNKCLCYPRIFVTRSDCHSHPSQCSHTTCRHPSSHVRLACRSRGLTSGHVPPCHRPGPEKCPSFLLHHKSLFADGQGLLEVCN